MPVGVFVDPVFYKIGTAEFLNSFFSTVYVRLENSDWGSKYPIIMNHLYNGGLKKEEIIPAKEELLKIRGELKELLPGDVIWDFENLDIKAPWGDKISADITNLSNYFITTDGDNLFDVLEKAMETGAEIEEDLQIKSL